MSIYGVERVKLDAGKVVRARLRRINEKGEWSGESDDASAADIASLILSGHRVIAIFLPTVARPMQRSGGEFRVETFDDETRGIKLDENSEGRKLTDLAKLE